MAQWLRCCTTNRKVAASITYGVIGIFHWHNPSDRTMALGSTQPLTEMSTRRISWGKFGRCVRLTTLPPSCAVVMKSGDLNFMEPSGPLQTCNGTDLYEVKCSDVEWTGVIYVKWFCFEVQWSSVKWSEVSYSEVLGDKSTMYIRVTLYWGYLTA